MKTTWVSGVWFLVTAVGATACTVDATEPGNGSGMTGGAIADPEGGAVAASCSGAGATGATSATGVTGSVGSTGAVGAAGGTAQIGDPCSEDTQCASGTCANESWCSNYCVTDQDCGSNSSGLPNYCEQGAEAVFCFPSCLDAACPYAGTSCLQDPQQRNVCSPQ